MSVMTQPRIEIRDLRLVQAIVSQGTTAAAARALGMTQSGVSHQLRNLEDRLGLEVFERKGRTLALSDAGSKMLHAGRTILDAMAALESDLNSGKDASLTLRVATHCYTAYSWLPRATVEMRTRGVALQVKPVVPRSPTLDQALLEGEIDLALNLGATSDARICQRRLFHDELVLLTSIAHPLASRQWVEGNDLFDEDLLMLEVAQGGARRVQHALFPRGGGFRSVARLPLAEAIIEMVKAGLGVSILPTWSISPHIARGDIACIRLGKSGLVRKWVASYRRDTRHARSIRELLVFVAKQAPPRLLRVPARRELPPAKQ